MIKHQCPNRLPINYPEEQQHPSSPPLHSLRSAPLLTPRFTSLARVPRSIYAPFQSLLHPSNAHALSPDPLANAHDGRPQLPRFPRLPPPLVQLSPSYAGLPAASPTDFAPLPQTEQPLEAETPTLPPAPIPPLFATPKDTSLHHPGVYVEVSPPLASL